MKKSSALLIAAALILSSCGTVARYASSDNGQQFQDGIYSNTPAFRTKVEKEESKSDTQALVEKTQASPIYLFGEKKDTVMIPRDMSAVIRYDQKLGGTVVTVGENPYDWRYDLENNYGYYYGPYSIGSSWYWSRHYNPWYSWSFSPWRYHGWYDPWYYGSNWGWGWYDPWYYGGYWGGYYGGWYSGWYDPWYYGGYWGSYSPWYYSHLGWYDPYWGHHHGPGLHPDKDKDVWYGSRHQTGSERVFGSTSSIRGGIGNRSTVSRNESAGRTASTAVRNPSSTGRTTVSRTPAGRGATASGSAVPSRVSANRTTAERVTSTASRPVSGTSTGRATSVAAGRASSATSSTPSSTTVQSNHRRPAVVTSDRTSSGSSYIGSGSSASGRTSVSSGSQSGYNNRSSVSAGSSSYQRSSSSTSSSSSFSSGSSRSSSGGGFSGGSSGASRSGGASGGRR